MKSLAVLVESEIKPMSSGEVMHGPIDAFSQDELVVAQALAKFMYERLEKRLELLRAALLIVASKTGVVTPAGGRMFTTNGTVVRVDRKVAKLPDEEKFKTMLAVKGIAEETVYDKKVSLVLNPSKLNALIELGKLDGPEVEALKKVTHALYVDPAREIEDLVEAAFVAFAEQKEQYVEDPAFAAAALAADVATQKPGKKKNG